MTYQPGPSDADIIEFMNAKVQRLSHIISQLIANKPAAHFMEAVVADSLVSPEAAAAIMNTYEQYKPLVLQVLVPVSKDALSEVIRGEFDLVDEVWPTVKEAIAVHIASYVLRHSEPDPNDFDTKILLSQILDPDNRIT